ncbi:hypothetical protein LSAT2_006371 [Lamellibrachia satsuma]|nr:hypothetical protein LSAT2_006371 [Lamellibrachia satsuma]
MSVAGRCRVNVAIADENDNTPRFEAAIYSGEMSYDETISDILVPVRATDPDAAENGTILYTMTKSSDPVQVDAVNVFQVDLHTGDITKTRLASPTIDHKYVMAIVATDTGNPPNSAFVNVRIDTFDGNAVAVSLKLALTQVEFDSLKDAFLEALRRSIASRHPTAVCKLWKTTLRKEVISTTTARRRLLQTTNMEVEYVTAAVYAIYDSVGNDLVTGKKFLTSAELLLFWQASSQSDIPAALLTGPEYQAFKIVSVAKYEKPAPTPWHKTATGIIVICFSVLGLVFLIAVSLSLTWYYRYYRPKRRGLIEVRPAPPVGPSRAEVFEPFTQTTSPKTVNTKKVHITLVEEKKKEALATSSPPTPRLRAEGPFRFSQKANSPFHDGDNKAMSSPPATPPTKRRSSFNGKAYDPTTGRMYEYNTSTGERRWIKGRALAERGASPPPSYVSHL